MNRHTRKLLTIITEAALETMLVHKLENLGVRGYTITDARGKGHRGVRNAGWEASSNLRIEIVCDGETADKVTDYLREHYYEHYAMILFIVDVEVLRPHKF